MKKLKRTRLSRLISMNRLTYMCVTDTYVCFYNCSWQMKDQTAENLHHMLQIWVSLSGRSATRLHPGLALGSRPRSWERRSFRKAERLLHGATASTNKSVVLLLFRRSPGMKRDIVGESLAGKRGKREMVTFQRNVIVIDASGELVVLSSSLPCQNMSKRRLVTFREGGDGKIHHATERGKFRMTDHNKQSQEVGSDRHSVGAVCF